MCTLGLGDGNVIRRGNRKMKPVIKQTRKGKQPKKRKPFPAQCEDFSIKISTFPTLLSFWGCRDNDNKNANNDNNDDNDNKDNNDNDKIMIMIMLMSIIIRRRRMTVIIIITTIIITIIIISITRRKRVRRIRQPRWNSLQGVRATIL